MSDEAIWMGDDLGYMTETEFSIMANTPDIPMVADEQPPVTLNDIATRIDNLEAKFDGVVSMVEKLIANVEPYLKDISPMIDAVANNPMFKMFTGTKGNKKND